MAKTETAREPIELTGVGRCLAQIRQMILSGELLPGQKVHQGELAEQLNLSRIPVREALSTLQAEGVLVHKPNTGFTVARFNSEDLSEIYLMRRLLETELLRSIDLTKVDADELFQINCEMGEIPPSESPEEYQKSNGQFHFRLFEYSPLPLVRNEVSRLWYMSGFYRSLYLYEVEASKQVYVDHERIIKAVRENDIEELIRASDEHRSSTERLVIQRLGRSRPI
ncbi:MAG: GntR family transcriptional regulator [Nocardioidaceae bacterium]|nr:GntR family transcriptional regulator [Nocardioidaceae bacterium]